MAATSGESVQALKDFVERLADLKRQMQDARSRAADLDLEGVVFRLTDAEHDLDSAARFAEQVAVSVDLFGGPDVASDQGVHRG